MVTIMRRRSILRLLAGASGLALLTACRSPAVSSPAQSETSARRTAASTPAEPAAGSGSISLSVMAWGNFVQQKVMQQALQEFDKQHPNVKASYISTQGGNQYTKLDTMIAGGVPPDVFYLDPPHIPVYAVKGALTVIDSFVQTAKYDLHDFYPKALKQYYWHNQLYGLPRGFGNQDLYWNEDLFTKAGASHPGEHWNDPAWTVDAFLSLADRLTRRQGSRVVQYGYGQALGLRQWEPWVWIFGGQVVDPTNRRCLLDQTPAMAGLQFLADLMHKYQVMPTPQYTQQENNTNLFASGRLAMNMDIPAALTSYRKLTSIPWDVAPLPKKAIAATSGGGICWAMIAKPPHPHLTWDLLAWVAGKHVQTMECQAATVAPPRQSVANSGCYVKPSLPPKHMEVFLNAPTYVHIDPQSVYWAQIDTLLGKELGYLWDGSKTAQEILPNLTPKITAMLQQ